MNLLRDIITHIIAELYLLLTGVTGLEWAWLPLVVVIAVMIALPVLRIVLRYMDIQKENAILRGALQPPHIHVEGGNNAGFFTGMMAMLVVVAFIFITIFIVVTGLS